ncbi:glycosyltransferase [Microbulbifer sp. OS29]|uniref:Glycosyltransferase n=1 Tax=Microbulbifer okhotskensis TaxID=2926617 RepID=A0A9X2J4P1_9GAMM|nr:glycosyltransferase family 2 protein [Microbulbifer okhotskensis]MCO1333539.1 glycosyltransferase [Microbulbifer okhotskensis]
MIKISLITVCLNSAETIRDTIRSVLAQDYADIEHIIIDGGSTDGTLEVILEFKDRVAVIVSEKDGGIYDAMNKGIRLASGDIVGTINSDDVYTDNRVISSVVHEFLISEAQSVYADLEIVDRNDLSERVRFYGSSKFQVSKFRWGWMPPHPTFFVRRDCYKRLGLYKTDYRVAADFELLARFLYGGRISFRRLPKCIVKMREGGVSSSGFWGRLHQNLEIVRACKENHIYTNFFLILFKIPLKLLEYTNFVLPQKR